MKRRRRSVGRSTSSPGQNRQGIAAFWVIAAAPCLVILLCVVIDVGRLWLARVELEDALEAAALASVQDWGESGGGETLPSRQRGQALAAANVIRGVPLVLDDNYDNSGSGGPNQNDSCAGDLVFGVITNSSPPFEFDAGVDGTTVDTTAVRAQKTVQINSLCQNFLGIPVGPFDITAMSTARYDDNTGTTALIKIGSFVCP